MKKVVLASLVALATVFAGVQATTAEVTPPAVEINFSWDGATTSGYIWETRDDW